MSKTLKPKYFPIQQRWRKLKPLYEQPLTLKMSWVEMESFRQTDFEENGISYNLTPFDPSSRPYQYDTCGWRWADPGCGRPGRKPAFWDWACYRACHWVANANLRVISQLEPEHNWRIATSIEHTTLVDLDRKLMFDTNFLAMGISEKECWKSAVKHPTSCIFDPGTYMLHDIDMWCIAACDELDNHSLYQMCLASEDNFSQVNSSYEKHQQQC